MSEDECPRCASDEGHYEWELIYVDGKYFCPYDYRRCYTEEEALEMTATEAEEAEQEKLQCVRRASYKIIKVPREEKEKA